MDGFSRGFRRFVLLWVALWAMIGITWAGPLVEMPFDFNGDGRADLVLIRNIGGSSVPQLLVSTGATFQAVCTGPNTGNCGIPSAAFMSNPNTRLLYGDFNGDGKSDLLLISGDPAVPRRLLLLSNGTSFAAACDGQSDGACGFDTEAYMFDSRTKVITGDFNGDGKTDVLVISGDPSFPRRQLLLSTGSTFAIACSSEVDGACGFDTEAYMFDVHTKFITGDFNGDGKSDVVVISGDPTFPRRMILLSTGTNFNVTCFGQQDGSCGLDTEAYMFNIATKFIAADFNGDGKADILVVSGDPAFPRRALLFSNGTQFVVGCFGEQDEACGLDTEPYMFHPLTKLIPGDFNGDGKADIAVVSGDPSFPRRALLLSNGVAFVSACFSEQDNVCGFDTEPYMFRNVTQLIAGDFNGDGKTDVFTFSGDASFPRRYLLNSNGAGFDNGCFGQTDGACGISQSYVLTPTATKIVPNYSYNFPARQWASTFTVDPAPLPAEPSIRNSLQWALDSGALTIEFDGANGQIYYSGPVWARSNQTLTWSSGVGLKAQTGAFPGDSDSLVTLDRVQNVRLQGGTGSFLSMNKSEYARLPPAQWRHTVNILSASNVAVDGLTLMDSGGDGIYLGDASPGTPNSTPNSNIVINNIIADSNSRNGLSVIDVDGMTVSNSTFSNTAGLGNSASGGPWAGIDFEPNNNTQVIRGVLVQNCTLTGNHGYGVDFDLKKSPYAQPIDIELAQVTLSGNGGTMDFQLGPGLVTGYNADVHLVVTDDPNIESNLVAPIP
jgi:hypothetical protein